jgi:hypothetical protein
MSDEIATRSIQRPRSTPVAALRATEKRWIPPSLNGHEQTDFGACFGDVCVSAVCLDLSRRVNYLVKRPTAFVLQRLNLNRIQTRFGRPPLLLVGLPR